MKNVSTTVFKLWQLKIYKKIKVICVQQAPAEHNYFLKDFEKTGKKSQEWRWGLEIKKDNTRSDIEYRHF